MMDEVLAVGDAAFQQKCLDKMHDIRQQGRTILFVSHDMAAITRLCKRVVLLETGRIACDGEPHQVVNHYLSSSLKTGALREWTNGTEAPGDEVVRLRRVRVRAETGETISVVDIRKPFGIELTYEVLRDSHALVPVLEFYNEAGTELFSTHDTKSDWRRRERPRATYTSTVWIPGNLLAEGSFDWPRFDHVPLSGDRAARLRAQRRRVSGGGQPGGRFGAWRLPRPTCPG